MTLRLHYNENTAGCSPAVIRALRDLTPVDLATYEDDRRWTSDVGRSLGVPSASLLLTNGLDEGLLLAAQLASLESRMNFEAIVVEPAFEMYSDVARTTGGEVVRVMPVPGFAFDPARVLARATDRTRLVFLCDPNNPTGLGIARTDIGAVADALPNAFVFVDEAYADFSGRTLIGPDLSGRPNVIVGRTFAKAHGLAALRIGALVAAETTISRLRRLALPYRINLAAAVALRAALADRAQVERAIADAAVSRTLLAGACARLGLETWPSEANFLLVRVRGGATECAAFMEARGVRVRDRSSLPGCEGCLRITTGRVAHTQTAVGLLEEWHAARGR